MLPDNVTHRYERGKGHSAVSFFRFGELFRRKKLECIMSRLDLDRSSLRHFVWGNQIISTAKTVRPSINDTVLALHSDRVVSASTILLLLACCLGNYPRVSIGR